MNAITESYLGYLNISSLNEQEFMENIENYLSESLISKETILKSYKTNINVVEKFLKDHNIDIDSIKSEGKKAVSFILNQEKQGVDVKDTAKKLINSVRNKLIARMEDTRKIEVSLPEKIVSSIAIFIVVLYVNTILHSLALTVFSPVGAMLFLGCIVAPIVEEYAKRFALLQNYPFVYTGIFAGLEALIYIVNLSAMGLPMATILIQRISAVLLHFSTLMIQKTFHDKAIETDSPALSKAGYFVGVFTHFLWNFNALKALI